MEEFLNRIDNFQIIADIFKILGDNTRVRIFWLLCHYEKCVVDIAAMMNMSSPAVSHHLKPLRKSGLILSRREGKEVYYKATDTPESLLLHQVIELVMEISCPDLNALPDHLNHAHPDHFPEILCGHCHECHTEDTSEPEAFGGKKENKNREAVREIHELLTTHLDRRWNVEELARQYLMNPTTLKQVFKESYGMSIAAHIRLHRMEEAARLLRETSLPIARIAAMVGYGSQSKFTAVFKECYQMLPKEYRKK